MAKFAALNMLVNRRTQNSEAEASLARRVHGLDRHQPKILAQNYFAYGTLNVVDGSGTGKTHAVLVLVLAVLLAKRGRAVIVCGNEKQADHFASRPGRMVEAVENPTRPGAEPRRPRYQGGRHRRGRDDAQRGSHDRNAGRAEEG